MTVAKGINWQRDFRSFSEKQQQLLFRFYGVFLLFFLFRFERRKPELNLFLPPFRSIRKSAKQLTAHSATPPQHTIRMSPIATVC